MIIKEYSKDNITIIRETKGTLPSLPFVDIKNAILGKDYELTVIFVGRKKGQALHKKIKGKDTPLNILSFRFDETTGEIYIGLEQARKECKNFERTYINYLAFLFIHGCSHLHGYTHGHKMEQFEKKIRKHFHV